MLDPQVAEAQLLGGRTRLGDLAPRRVDADELAPGKVERHRDEVRAHRATELQDAAAIDGSGIEAEEPGERGEAIGVRLGEAGAYVGNFVIGRGPGLRAGGAPGPLGGSAS